MKRVLVTGAAGFIGRNLAQALGRHRELEVTTFTEEDDDEKLESALSDADVVYHLAGVNRPETEDEFLRVNVGLTRTIVASLERSGKRPTVVMPSSIQAALDNPYGRSKKAAEDVLRAFGRETGAPVAVYRLPNVFGKWSRPNYNTVVATYCHNIARGLEITISDPDRELELVYIGDVVDSFLRHLERELDPGRQRYEVSRVFRVTLKELAAELMRFRDSRESLVVPDLADGFRRRLYATYISFLPKDDFGRAADVHSDERGWLFELIKSEHCGQIFVSTTQPGVIRGDHYHDTKVEKFCLIQGEGLIRFRALDSDELLEYPVDDGSIKIVDIPPGYAHSIENVGKREMIVLFWANEIFEPDHADTHYLEVLM